ncbi:MAG: ribonuclease HII [Dehalococcoidia bacterium]|nr:ribonuclease HII [Dehalococcoidia bacterium]
MTKSPSFDEEVKLRAMGFQVVAGVDEVGRGALAGPVTAAAVVLPPGAHFPWLKLVRDSKQLSPKLREKLFSLMQTAGIVFGLGSVPHSTIDEVGIARATRMAMARAVAALPLRPDFLLIDALRLPEVNLPQKGIVKGDQLCFSIACASIVAKVSRDREMTELDRVYPGYGLAQHKGYGTMRHLHCLNRLGPCAIHRRSFAPVVQLRLA